MIGAIKNMTRSTGMVLALFVLSIAFVSITTPDEAHAKNVYKVHVDAGGDVSDAGDGDGISGVSITYKVQSGSTSTAAHSEIETNIYKWAKQLVTGILRTFVR